MAKCEVSVIGKSRGVDSSKIRIDRRLCTVAAAGSEENSRNHPKTIKLSRSRSRIGPVFQNTSTADASPRPIRSNLLLSMCERERKSIAADTRAT